MHYFQPLVVAHGEASLSLTCPWPPVESLVLSSPIASAGQPDQEAVQEAVEEPPDRDTRAASARERYLARKRKAAG